MIIGILSIVLGCEIGKYEVDSQMFVNWNDTLTFSAGLILGGITLATFINLIQPFFLSKIYEIYQD